MILWPTIFGAPTPLVSGLFDSMEEEYFLVCHMAHCQLDLIPTFSPRLSFALLLPTFPFCSKFLQFRGLVYAPQSRVCRPMAFAVDAVH